MDNIDTSNILNQGKVITAKTMLNLEYITVDQYKEFIRNYFILSTPANALSKLGRKLLKHEHDTRYSMYRLELSDTHEDDLQIDELVQQSNRKPKIVKTDRFDDLE